MSERERTHVYVKVLSVLYCLQTNHRKITRKHLLYQHTHTNSVLLFLAPFIPLFSPASWESTKLPDTRYPIHHRNVNYIYTFLGWPSIIHTTWTYRGWTFANIYCWGGLNLFVEWLRTVGMGNFQNLADDYCHLQILRLWWLLTYINCNTCIHESTDIWKFTK